MRFRVALLVICLLGVAAAWTADLRAQDTTAEIKNWTKQETEKLVALYRHFHAHPELPLHEKETAQRVAQEWKEAGFEVTQNVGGHGVVAILKNGLCVQSEGQGCGRC